MTSFVALIYAAGGTVGAVGTAVGVLGTPRQLTSPATAGLPNPSRHPAKPALITAPGVL